MSTQPHPSSFSESAEIQASAPHSRKSTSPGLVEESESSSRPVQEQVTTAADSLTHQQAGGAIAIGLSPHPYRSFSDLLHSFDIPDVDSWLPWLDSEAVETTLQQPSLPHGSTDAPAATPSLASQSADLRGLLNDLAPLEGAHLSPVSERPPNSSLMGESSSQPEPGSRVEGRVPAEAVAAVEHSSLAALAPSESTRTQQLSLPPQVPIQHGLFPDLDSAISHLQQLLLPEDLVLGQADSSSMAIQNTSTDAVPALGERQFAPQVHDYRQRAYTYATPMQPATADTGSPRAARARTLTSVPADNLFSSFSSATLTSLDEVAGVTQTQVSWRSQPQADNSMADGVAMSTEVPHLVQAPTNSLGSEQADQEVATTSSRGARYRSTSDPRGASSDSEFRAEHTSRPERRNLPNLWRATTNWFTRSRSPSPRIRSATGGEGGLRAVIDRVRSRNEERREASREGVVPSSTRSRLSFPMTRTSAVQAQDASRDIVGTEWGFAPEESTRTMTAVTRSSPPAGTHILLPAPRTDRRRSALTSSGRQSGERVYADRRRVSFRSPGQQSNLPSEASRDEELRSSVRGAARYSGSLAGPSLAPQTVPESDQTTGQAETALQAALRRARNDFPRLYDLAEAGRSSQIGLRLVPPELNTTLYGSDAVRAVRAAAIDAERHIEDILAQLSQPLQGHGAGAPFRIHRRQLDQHVASACRAVREELERCSAEALRNHLLNPYNLAYLMSTQVVRLAEETLRAYTPMWGWYELFRYWRFVLEQRVSLLRLWISTVDRESWRQNAHGIVLLTGGVGLVQGSLLEMESAIGVQPDLI